MFFRLYMIREALISGLTQLSVKIWVVKIINNMTEQKALITKEMDSNLTLSLELENLKVK